MTSPVPTGTVATRRFAVTVAPDAPRSQAYFLRRPLVGALYDWSGVPLAWRGLPFEPPPVLMTVRLTIAGQALTLSREVVYRYRDQRTGEVRRPLFVTRPFDVAVAPELVVWPVDGAAGGPRHFTITVTNRARGPAVAQVVRDGAAGLDHPPTDSLRSSERRVEEPVSRSRRRRGSGPVVRAQGRRARGRPPRSDGALVLIDYHISGPARWSTPRRRAPRGAHLAAAADTRRLRAGRVRSGPRGAAGRGRPDRAARPDTLARGDLSRYDAIVIEAGRTRPSPPWSRATGGCWTTCAPVAS